MSENNIDNRIRARTTVKCTFWAAEQTVELQSGEKSDIQFPALESLTQFLVRQGIEFTIKKQSDNTRGSSFNGRQVEFVCSMATYKAIETLLGNNLYYG